MDHFRHFRSRRAVIAAGIGAVITALVPLAHASSWDPTLLVNTESFQIIDDGDGTTNIELRFGDTVNEILRWNVTTGRFEFTDDLTVKGNMSGMSLTVTNLLSCNSIDTDAQGNAICGTDDSGSGLSIQQAFDYFVNVSGDTMTGALRISNGAGLTASGGIKTESGIVINKDNTAQDAVLTFGNDAGTETLRFNDSTERFEFSDDLHTTGNFTSSGTIVSDGSISTKTNLTINSDNGGTDAILTFGNDAGSETIRFSDTLNRFVMSDDLTVQGNMSGQNLTVSSSGINMYGVQYYMPSAQGASGQVLVNDGNGNLVWKKPSIGPSSGDIMYLVPEYPHAIPFASGSAIVGQLTLSGGLNASDNFYRWTTSRSADQQYWIAARVRVPTNFNAWDPVQPIRFTYQTGLAATANNFVTLRMTDTANANVVLTGGETLASTAITTGTVTGPQSAGTYTPGGYITLYVKLSADNTTNAAASAGKIQLNWETRTP